MIATETPTDTPHLDPRAEEAIALTHQHAPETRFGARLVARPVAGQPDYQQVNRVDKHGLVLLGGWTFLVNTRTKSVIRTTAAQPEQLDFADARRRGTVLTR